MTIITPDLLKSWSPCIGGYKRFCELFPAGADLKTACDGLVADNHDEWGQWLFNAARNFGGFEKEVAAGYRNTGHQNTGHQNTGDRNTGDRNTGDWNTGDRNTGHRNTGDWNTGDRNTGYFNTVTPEDVLAFNKPCKRTDWESATIPDFLYFSPTEWICDSDMTDQEKVDNPKFYVAGGYLKKFDYKVAFKKAWDESDAEDRALVEKLPNFDADLFLEISGIDVRSK